MSDFYSDATTPAPRVLIPRFAAPAQVTIGADGIPDYVEATKGSPYQYIAPEGFRLAIFHYGVRLEHIVAADRLRGFAVGLHYEWNREKWAAEFLPTDSDGQTQHRFYQAIPGQKGPPIKFRLIYGPGPKVFGLSGEAPRVPPKRIIRRG